VTPTLLEAIPRLRDSRARSGRYLRSLEEVRDSAREYADRHARPRALEIDRRTEADASYFDWELVRAGCSYGLLSLAIPKPAGGRGALGLHVSIAMEELCVACPAIANVFGAHGLGLAPLVLLGGPAHWDGVLREIVREEREGRPLLMAFAITEPGAGTDVEDPDLMRGARMATTARRVSGGYRLSGTKHFISNGSVARWISVCMPTDPLRPAETATLFLVDAESEGFSVGRVEHKMGQRACPAAELVFNDVFVPNKLVIGREGDGLSGTLLVLALSRGPVGAIATGIARGAYERLLAWLASDPAACGLAERQEVQLALASMEEDIHLARQAYVDAATEFELAGVGRALRNPTVRAASHVPAFIRRHRPLSGWLASPAARERAVSAVARSCSDREATRSLALSSLAKARGADVAMRVTGLALEIAGLGAGSLTAELEKLWRDAKLTQIYEGTNQLNRLEVFRGLSRGETLPVLPARNGAAASATAGATA